MELTIYDKNGNARLTVSPNSSSTLTEEVGGQYCVNAGFTHYAFIPLDVDDYIEVAGVRYRIRNRYRPKERNKKKYEYTVTFYAPIHDAEDALMLFTEGDTTSEFAFDGGPLEHLQIWVSNMNRIAGSELWKIGSVISADPQTIEYNNVTCWEAAFGSNGIAAVFGTELWADGYTVNLCKASRGERVTLGYLNGLTSLSQEDNGEVDFFTRLVPLGSTRNIDPSKYGYARLQLPSRAKYVDLYTYLYGIKERVEESAFAGIYPKYTGTVGTVRTEEKTSEEGRDYTVYYFTDPGMTFNPLDYQIPDYTFMLAFQSGELAGRGEGEDGSFEAAWHSDTGEWEIINRYPDDTTQVPGGLIVPKEGDTYIPWNFSLPDEYITAAEQAFQEAVEAYLSQASFDPNKYSGTTDRNHIERNAIGLMVGMNVRLESGEYFPELGYLDTRITKIVRKLNDLNQATVTCCEKIGTNWRGSVNSQLDNLQYIVAQKTEQTLIDIIKTTDSKTPSDVNVYSALSSFTKFLNKDRTDSTNYLQRFLGGIDVGQFTAGMIGGSGARIDQYGDAEMRSLILRDSLTVPKITFNCIDVISGDKANSFAYGTIKSVDTENRIAELDLLDDQAGTLHVNDICRGVFHLYGESNSTEDAEDANGFYQYSGFSTSYFTPTEILTNEPGIFRFRYEIQQGTTVHPRPGMNFYAYGNFIDTGRQAITYETRYYTRRLKGVNTWAINPTKNISMQTGKLDGLVIGGMEMTGYGTYSENNYFTGVQIQFTPEQEESLRGESAYSVSLSEDAGVVVLDEEGNLKSGFLDVTDVVSGSSDVISGASDVVVSHYRIKTRIQAFRGSTELAYSETFANGTYLVTVEPYGCTCELTDGVVCITGVTDTNYAYVDIVVNCEGNAEFRKTYTLTFVREGATPVLIDLDNEMGSLAADSLGNVTSGLPFSTTARAYYGNEEVAVSAVRLDVPEGVTASVNGNVINVTAIAATTGEQIVIGVDVDYTYSGTVYTKHTTLTLIKFTGAEDAVVYDLMPTANVVKKAKDGTLSVSSVCCNVKKVAGANAAILESLPDGLRMTYTINDGDEFSYTYQAWIGTGALRTSLKFRLYQGDTLLDMETIFLVEDGQDGEDGAPGAPGEPGEPGTPGEPGASGYSLRVSEWAAGVTYSCDTEPDESGVRYLDIALVRNDLYDSGWECYECLLTHTSSADITTANTTYWKPFSSNVGSIFASLILAKNAVITFMQGNSLKIQNSSGTVEAGMSGSTSGKKIRIWAGSSTPDSAPFRVDANGALYASNATITGAITATSGSFTGAVYATRGSFTSGTFTSCTISKGTIKEAAISYGTIDNAAITNGTIDNAAITNGTIDNAAITNGTINNAAISSGTVETATIQNCTVDEMTVTDNSRIGPAVFNGNYMISLYGQDLSKTAQSETFGNFNSAWLSAATLSTSMTFIPKVAIDYLNGLFYSHASGNLVFLPSVCIGDGKIVLKKRSIASSLQETCELINGTVIFHRNGGRLFSVDAGEEYGTVEVYGYSLGCNTSALVKFSESTIYNKVLPFHGSIDVTGYWILSLNGVLFYLRDDTAMTIDEWLNEVRS